MIITKAQSKQLRYACGAVDYNQPCTRKYTWAPEGKLREIGRFKYIENRGELKSLTFDGGAVNLDGIPFDVLLACVMEGDGLDPIQVAALPEPKKPSDIEDAAALALTIPGPAVTIHLDVARGNDVHAVNIPVTVEAAVPAEPPTDDWCTPDNISDWEEPDELKKIKQAEDRKKLEGEPEKESAPPKVAVTGDAAPLPHDSGSDYSGIGNSLTEEYTKTREEFENALRETAMNAAAREALHMCNIECGPECYVAANILRVNKTVPYFLGNYGKCLEQVGTPHSIEEIVAALPNQEKWLHSLAINAWKIKD